MSFEEDDVENTANNIIDENDEILNLAIKNSLKDSQTRIVNSSNDEDEQLRKAIEDSLFENQKQNDELFNSVLYESLDTVNTDDDDDKILEKVIEESHLSNISIRLNTEIINSGMSSNIASIINMSNTIATKSDFENPSHNEYNEYNDYHEYNSPDEYDDEEYMKMIIQQIKENEELETKVKKNINTKTIIEEQDFEYEEALKKDIEKDMKKEKSKILSINNIENYSDTIDSKKIEDYTEPDIPKTKEEMRKLRLAFFDKNK
jgi:hypothetical protein